MQSPEQEAVKSLYQDIFCKYVRFETYCLSKATWITILYVQTLFCLIYWRVPNEWINKWIGRYHDDKTRKHECGLRITVHLWGEFVIGGLPTPNRWVLWGFEVRFYVIYVSPTRCWTNILFEGGHGSYVTSLQRIPIFCSKEIGYALSEKSYFLWMNLATEQLVSFMWLEMKLTPWWPYLLREVNVRQSLFHCMWYLPVTSWKYINLHAWASYQKRKIEGCACAGIARNVSPLPQVSNSDRHHGTGVTHVSWCISGSLTCGFLWCRLRGNVPGIPGTTRNFTYQLRGQLDGLCCIKSNVCLTLHQYVCYHCLVHPSWKISLRLLRCQ